MTSLNLADEWSFLERPTDGRTIDSRATSVSTADGNVLIALDSSRNRHLLVPVPPGRVVHPDRRSQGVILVAQPLVEAGTTRQYADLVCTEPALEIVFTTLAEDICQRLSADPTDAASTAARTLDEWRAMLRVAPSDGDRVGIHGELLVLRELVRLAGPGALSLWAGPNKAVHDFTSKRCALEVKATTARTSWTVEIHGVGQLESEPGRDLHLLLLRLEEDPTGETTAEIVDTILALGADRPVLFELLEQVGVRRDAEDRHVRRRLTGRHVWHVTPEFPGMRASDIPSGRAKAIQSLSYRLDLLGAGPTMPDSSVEVVLAALANGADA